MVESSTEDVLPAQLELVQAAVRTDGKPVEVQMICVLPPEGWGILCPTGVEYKKDSFLSRRDFRIDRRHPRIRPSIRGQGP